MQIELQPAYVLHTRPYRDTSMLVDFLSPHYGRFTAVARGVRSRKTPKRNLLNPFTCLLISFQGKADLKLLTDFEVGNLSFNLSEKYLYSGFYVNELLMRLLLTLDAHEDIFYQYQDALQCLHDRQDIEAVLRKFELCLLVSLGYGISFQADAKSGLPITNSQSYCLDIHQGFYLADTSTPINFQFNGQHILSILEQNYRELEVRRTAKRITRLLLQPLLGTKPLTSRALFV